MLESIIEWAITFVAGASLSALFTYVKVKNKQNNALEKGVQCLLRQSIINQNEKYTMLGYCPVYVKSSLSKEYTAYKNLGGNDVATHLYEETISLPDFLENEKENKTKKEIVKETKKEDGVKCFYHIRRVR